MRKTLPVVSCNYDPYDPPADSPSDPPPARDYRDNPNTDPPTGHWITPNPNDPNRPPAPRPQASPRKDSGAPTSSPDRPPSASPRIVATAYRPTTGPDGTEPITNDSGKRIEPYSARLRREVLKAMRALREMPPFAREREVDFGRYSNFSPEERDLLRNLDQ